MGKVGVISKENSIALSECVRGGEVTQEKVCGQEVVRIVLLRGGRRYLRRAVERWNIDRAVTEGEVPYFVEEVLKKSGVKIFDGKTIMRTALPGFLSRATKTQREKPWCTVYDNNLDGESIEIIKLTAERFRFVSLCSKSEKAPEVAAQILAETGLALKLGENKDGAAVVRSGEGGAQKVRINLEDVSINVFTDGNRKGITPALAEAIAGEGATEETLKNLGLKILI